MIAVEAQSESKWKQLGELAMSTGKVFLLLGYIFISSGKVLSGLVAFYQSSVSSTRKRALIGAAI